MLFFMNIHVIWCWDANRQEERKGGETRSRLKRGETNEKVRCVFKTAEAEMDKRQKTQGGRRWFKNPARSLTKAEWFRTSEDDGQKIEAALLSLSSHSALLSIREDWTPFNILQYTPSFTVRTSVCVYDLIGPARCRRRPSEPRGGHVIGPRLHVFPVTDLWGHWRLMKEITSSVCLWESAFLPEAGGICAFTFRTTIPPIFISTPVVFVEHVALW